MTTKRLFAALPLLALALVAGAQGNPDDIARLIDNGKRRNQVMRHLDTISHKIGPRLTGSTNLAKGQQWAMAEFKKWGLKNVHLEQWGDVPVGFDRGPRQIARMASPWKIDFQFTTPAWGAGTNRMVRAKAVLQPVNMDELNARRDELKGKWIVMKAENGMRGPTSADPELDKALDALGIAGRVYGTADERVHTNGRYTGLTMDNLPKVPQIKVRKSDFDAINVGIKAGRDVVLEFDIENRFFKGPVPQYNLIAEIPGTEKPDEVVIVCGHFDSWNGPGSQGTNDNGTGSAVAMEAARLIMASGLKPKRTIRFILWSGEEQGLLGSTAYVQAHKGEMDKISAVFNDDGGTNYQGGYACLESMAPMLKQAMSPVEAAFPDLPMRLNIVATMPGGGSSDHAPFVMAGVPGFYTIESGRADYGFIWHTQNDRYENAIPEYLVQSSTNAAVVAFNVANAATLMPRGAKPTGTVQGEHDH